MAKARWLSLLTATILGAVPAVQAQEPAPPAKPDRISVEDVSYVLTQLTLIRSMIELYTIQKGTPPDFRAGWSLLVSGAYIEVAPANPFASPDVATVVALSDIAGEDGTAVAATTAGWVWNTADKEIYATGKTEDILQELLRSDDLRFRTTPLEAALNNRLANLRRGVIDFKIRRALKMNVIQNPTLAEVTQPGLILKSIPTNPVNGSAEVQAATWNKANPPVKGTAGWNYDQSAGEVWPNCRITKDSVPADRSLTVGDYRSKGVPDPKGGPWTGHTTLEVVRDLKKAGRLPRMDSPNSGTLFAHLVSPDNFDSCRDRTRKVENRLLDAAKHLTANGELLDIYARAFAAAEVGDRDVIAVQGQALRAAALMADLGEEILAEESTDPLVISRRRKSIDQINGLLTDFVEKNLQMLDHSQCSPASNKRLMQEMTRTIPAIVARLSERQRIQIAEQIRAIENDDLQPGLKQLAAAVNAALAAEQNAAAEDN